MICMRRCDVPPDFERDFESVPTANTLRVSHKHMNTVSMILRVVWIIPLPLQIEHLHNVKCRELGAGVMTMPRNAPGLRTQPQPRRTPRRTYASEDNTGRYRSRTSRSWIGRRTAPQLTSSPLQGSWRARTAATADHHASDSDLAALGALEQEGVDHSAVMSSGLYQASGAVHGMKSTDAAPPVPQHADQVASEVATADLRPAHDKEVQGPAPLYERSWHSMTAVPGDGLATVDSPSAAALPCVDSFTTPFEVPCVPEQLSQGRHGEAQPSHDVVQGFPVAPLHTDSVSSGSQEHCSMNGEKSSIFRWLPGHVTGIEQEALQLGVERTGPFFHSTANETPLQDVVEINISSCRQGESVSVSSPQLRAATQSQTAASDTAMGSLHANVKGIHQGAEDAHTERAAHDCATVLSAVADAARLGTGTSQHGVCTPNPSAPVMFREEAPLVHEPYTLTAVGHSLGGAALLIYIVQFRRTQRRHRLSRLVLLTPAGFMDRIPSVVRPIAFILPASLRLITWMFPAVVSLPFYVPSSMLRSLMFRLTADVSSMPALTKLVRCAPVGNSLYSGHGRPKLSLQPVLYNGMGAHITVTASYALFCVINSHGGFGIPYIRP